MVIYCIPFAYWFYIDSLLNCNCCWCCCCCFRLLPHLENEQTNLIYISYCHCTSNGKWKCLWQCTQLRTHCSLYGGIATEHKRTSTRENTIKEMQFEFRLSFQSSQLNYLLREIYLVRCDKRGGREMWRCTQQMLNVHFTAFDCDLKPPQFEL